MHSRLWLTACILGGCGSAHQGSVMATDIATGWANITCPADSNTTLPTPTYGHSGAVFTVCTETVINAPAKSVFNAIIDFASYPLWNTFVINVDPSLSPTEVQIGTPMTFTTVGLIPLVNTTSEEIVTVLEDGSLADYLLAAWRSNATEAGVLITAEHPNILVAQGENTTRYVSYETYYDEPLVGTLLLLRAQLQAAFDKQGEDLRAYIESLVL